jgi:type IV secretory pathway TrbF-like protein
MAHTLETLQRTKAESADKDPAIRSKLAARAWEESWSNLAAGRRNWMLAAFGLIGIVAALVAALWHVATLSKTDVYVLQRDAANQVSYSGPTKPADMDAATWDAVKVQSLKRFIESWRTVTSDRTAQATAWDRSFSYLGDASQAKRVVATWYQEHDPIKAADDGHLVTVQYKTYDVEGQHTYGIWWTETTTSTSGEVTAQKSWRARIVYSIRIPTAEKAREENPLGILITELQAEPVQ